MVTIQQSNRGAEPSIYFKSNKKIYREVLRYTLPAWGKLRADKIQQQGEMLGICCFESCDILLSRVPLLFQVCSAPSEKGFEEYVFQDEICHQSRMAAVTINKWVYPYESMMESDGNFVSRGNH